MDELVTTTPRWGSEGHKRKARAILRSIVSGCRRGFTDDIWLDIGDGGIASDLAPLGGGVVDIDQETWTTSADLAETYSKLPFFPARFNGYGLAMAEGNADGRIGNQIHEHLTWAQESQCPIALQGRTCRYSADTVLELAYSDVPVLLRLS